MKRAYLANGRLIQECLPQNNVLRVDFITYTYLHNLLGGDHCYLKLGRHEIVKVLGLAAPDTLLVARGIDESLRETVLIGGTVKYVITASELFDATSLMGYSINSIGGVNYVGGKVEYGPLDILGIGGIRAVVEGNAAMVYDIPENVGCTPQSPPDIPINYLFIRVLDNMEPRIVDDGSYRGYK